MKIHVSIFLMLLSGLLFSCEKQATPTAEPAASKASKQVLLIGTFHYHNPGADVAKTKSFDIMNEASQQELEVLAEKIKAFNPTKIFVEWSYDEQAELNALYLKYVSRTYFTQPDLSDFYQKNEIFQLAFRAAQKLGLKSVDAIDYTDTSFPFDSMMTVMEANKQVALQEQTGAGIKKFTQEFDSQIENGSSLTDLMLYLNTDDLRSFSNEFHNGVPLLVGDTENFIGPFLTAEWYKRNLYMWSLAQKKTNPSDERIMILVGASHAAIMEQFIEENHDWDVVGLDEVL
ncbi:MAG: DUF5694 domain-containing protein, partial [Bacteroidia bacterium]